MKRVLYYGTVLIAFACYFGWRWWESQPIVIRVAAGGAITLDAAPVSIGELPERLRAEHARRRRAPVVISADPALPASLPVEVGRQAREAGIGEIRYESAPP